MASPGAALFALFARARIGDLARCAVEPVLDVTDDRTGYVETRFELHKTARPGTRAMLPITANAFGVGRAPWAETWLRAHVGRALPPDAGHALASSCGCRLARGAR